MRRHALNVLACPACEGALRLNSVASENLAACDVAEGELACEKCAARYPIIRGVPRFVPTESYASSFGFQWNRFHQLQVDSVMHNDLSRDRFYKTTGWPTCLAGQLILEAGCGAGRKVQDEARHIHPRRASARRERPRNGP